MSERRKAIFFIFLTTVVWGVPPLFIHYFALHLDAHTQNFWRYVSALLFLVIYGFWRGELRADGGLRGLVRPAAAAALLVVYQTCFTLSLYYAMPALISLLIQLELIAAIALSCVFFSEERRIATSVWFIAGAVAALSGAVGMVVFSPDFRASGPEAVRRTTLLLAVALVGGAALFWGSYSVAIKWCLEVLPPFPAFIRVETMATGAFLVLSLLLGKPGEVFHAPPDIGILVFLSGALCIGLAHIFYTSAISVLGVVVCSTVILACPVVTAVASRIVFGERLAVLQTVSAAVLLAGAALSLQAQGRAVRRPVLPDK